MIRGKRSRREKNTQKIFAKKKTRWRMRCPEHEGADFILFSYF